MAAKLLTLESLDAGGKGTQVELLTQYFNTFSIKYKHFHFPMYGHNLFSKVISMFLKGDWGKNEEVDPYFIANAFAMDRWKFLPELNEHIENNDVIILDRYVFSNMAYQGAKLNGEESELIKNWIYKLEFSFLKLPYPDLNLFLDTPSKVLKNRLELRAKNETREYLDGKVDIHEADINFQTKVRETYLNLLGFPNYKIIPCTVELENEIQVLTPNEIFKSYKPYIDQVIFNNEINLNLS